MCAHKKKMSSYLFFLSEENRTVKKKMENRWKGNKEKMARRESNTYW